LFPFIVASVLISIVLSAPGRALHPRGRADPARCRRAVGGDVTVSVVQRLVGGLVGLIPKDCSSGGRIDHRLRLGRSAERKPTITRVAFPSWLRRR